MSEKYKFELNDKKLEQVTGGWADLGVDTCPTNSAMTRPSSSYCPTSGCSHYKPNRLWSDQDPVPFCAYYNTGRFDP